MNSFHPIFLDTLRVLPRVLRSLLPASLPLRPFVEQIVVDVIVAVIIYSTNRISQICRTNSKLIIKKYKFIKLKVDFGLIRFAKMNQEIWDKLKTKTSSCRDLDTFWVWATLLYKTIICVSMLSLVPRFN